jgi:hypothetical protein
MRIPAYYEDFKIINTATLAASGYFLKHTHTHTHTHTGTNKGLYLIEEQ